MSDVGQFDPEAFLNMPNEGEFSTAFVPVPEGEYTAIISKRPDVRAWQGKKDPSKSGISADVFWSIDDPGVKQLLERDQVVVKQGIMLDQNSNGGLDSGKGKNVQLGRLLEAVGLNGKKWSWNDFEGKVAKIMVKHRVDDGTVYAEVKSVAPLS